MPIPEKYSHEQIIELYKKWKESGQPLKVWVNTHHPPLNYVTIFKRFKRLEETLKRQSLEKPQLQTIEKTLEKEITKEISKEAKNLHDLYYSIGKKYRKELWNILYHLYNKELENLGRAISFEAQKIAKEQGINPKYLTSTQTMEIFQKNIDIIAKKNMDIIKNIWCLVFNLFFIKYGREPKSLEELSNFLPEQEFI
jgi:hypothetical protein